MAATFGEGGLGRAFAIGVLAAAIALQTLGCHRSAGASLTERAKEYWRLKQQRRWEEVYDGYLDPASKGTLERETFLKRRLISFDILNFDVADATANGDEATVTVKAKVRLMLRGPRGSQESREQEVTSRDSWVKRNGTWYAVWSE